jgi:alcohol dehydrogenase (cytochrome c)
MRYSIAGVVAGSLAGFALAASAAEVTSERLLNADNDPQNWLTIYGNYSAHMYSGLNQINRDNVSGLKLLYMHSILSRSGKPGNEEATPLVEDGYMYVNNAWGEVFRIDLRSGTRGRTLWINDAQPELAGAKRGLSMLGNYIYHNTRDLRLLKIDANSGETVFEVNTKAPETETALISQSSSSGSLAVKDRILVASSGGDSANRGWVAAFSADTGEFMWRFWIVPGPGEAGFETWADDHNAWKTGGGAIWTTGSYDPESNLVLYGTGNAVPMHDPEYRPGDNLYTSSVVAVDVDTGELAWYFQEVPNESWDWDTVNPRILYDVEIDGQLRKVQGNFSRNGFFYTLDRVTGEYISGHPYVEVNWTAGLDPKTGKPVEYDPSVGVQMYAPGHTIRAGVLDSSLNNCPHFYGMPTFFPPTYDDDRKMAWVEATDACNNQIMEKPVDRTVEWLGKDPRMPHTAKYPAIGQPRGRIVGIDVRTGMKVQEAHFEHPLYSGLLNTAGGLIFAGHVDGRFAAYDKDTLAELWSFQTGTVIAAPPISYSVDGHQYIAFVAGGRQVSQDMLAAPELDLVRQGAQVLVFGL